MTEEATVFGFCFFGVLGGDSGGGPIWSGGLAVFGFVQVCSDLFRFVRGVLEGLTVSTFVNLVST